MSTHFGCKIANILIHLVRYYISQSQPPTNVNYSKDYKHHLLSSLGWAKCFRHPHIIPESGIEQLLNTQHDKYEVILEFINIAY